ncbi:MAG TPA: hypothetical protein VJ987_08635 [Anaerolineales bacterium]|nr:hypothetical protein [Anaerolineales bacterium]
MHSTIVKKIIPLILITLIGTSCNGWTVQPLPYNPPTPFVLPTRTPAVFSPTPVIIGVTSASATPVVPADTITPTFFPTNTNMPLATLTEVPLYTYTPTSLVNAPALQILVLGCDTGVDITHGMGEVTNAYVTLKNIGNIDLTNLIATLYALDEGREHPDKVQEIASLPIRYEVTLKMTVDSTYKQESPIQVEVTSDQKLFPREGLASCRDIGLFAPKPESLNTPVPVNP